MAQFTDVRFRKNHANTSAVVPTDRHTAFDAPIPAAMYLRMSTEHQQYSLENQARLINEYAAARGFSVVQTYCDAAKSGVLLKNRNGLRQLLKDVV